MHIPVLGFIGTAVRTLWDKLRGRPTVQAGPGAIPAGGDQAISAPIATGSSVVATDQATVVASPSGGPTIIVQSGGTVNLVSYVDGLPQAKDPALRAAFEEGRRLQDEGYEAQNAHKHREAIDRFTRALGLAETNSQRAALHVLRGNSQYSISQYKNAQADYEETLKLAERISPVEDAAQARAAALGSLGVICADRGDPDKAEEHHKAALAIDREIDNRPGEAASLTNLGNVYFQRGELDKAEEQYEKALEIAREIGNRLREAQVLGNLGVVYSDRSELEKAEEHHEQALEIDREIGHRLGEACQLGNLGNVYAQRGDLDKAEEHYEKGLEIHREIGNRLGQANQLGNLGLNYAQRGRLIEAKDHLEEAQAIYRQIGAGGQGPEIVRKALELIAEQERRQQERGE